jgi:fission 1 protein
MLEHLVSKGGTRESLYLLAVAHFRAGQLLEARRWAEAALAVAPSCHQSEALRAACEEQLAEDALMAGLGVAGVGLATIAVALLAGAMRRKT